mmetsp:Transcript_107526/g.302661  ORF Transcript_107526/g.302661 Transcript_107526/m.302661 type:complete len:455 (+) Transcript_107526:82-1446(+)
MPRIRTLNTKKPPEGWDDVLPQLEEFQAQMRDAVNEPHEGKRRNEATWPITKIHYERSRYVYELFYKKKAISRELYDFLLQEKFADAALIAKWKKPGYEYLCSLSAIDKRNSNFGTTAICRVPLHTRKPGLTGPSVSTGCISCASQEAGRLGGPIWWDSPRPADLVGWAKAGCPTAEKPGKKRKNETEDVDAELEARAAALRKGSHAGVRDAEAEALEATARALRGGQGGGTIRGPEDESDDDGPGPRPVAEEDDDITGDEAPAKARRIAGGGPRAAASAGGGTERPPTGGTATPPFAGMPDGDATPPAPPGAPPVGGTETPPAPPPDGTATPPAAPPARPLAGGAEPPRAAGFATPSSDGAATPPAPPPVEGTAPPRASGFATPSPGGDDSDSDGPGPQPAAPGKNDSDDDGPGPQPAAPGADESDDDGPGPRPAAAGGGDSSDEGPGPQPAA